jgi:hypothetical protein
MISTVIGFLLLVTGYRIGRVIDCVPAQIDSQCGLTTTVWLIHGAAGGLAILLCAMVYTVVVLYRRCKTRA